MRESEKQQFMTGNSSRCSRTFWQKHRQRNRRFTVWSAERFAAVSRAVREYEDKCHVFCEQSFLCIAIIQDFSVKYANDAFLRMIGYAREEVLSWGKEEISKILHPDDRTFCLKQIAEKQAGGKKGTYSHAIRLIDKHNKLHRLEVFAKPIRMDNRWADMVIMLDVTDRGAEHVSERDQKQLFLSDKCVSLGMLIRSIAHELSSPNQAIILNAELLRKAASNVLSLLENYKEDIGGSFIAGLDYDSFCDKTHEIIDSIKGCAKLIESTIQELKAFATDTVSASMHVVNVNECLESVIRLMMPCIRKATNRFSCRLSTYLPGVIGDTQKLKQVFINLIKNACEALRDRNEGITVETRYSTESSRVQITISDEGKGIPKENISKIMEPFFTTKKEQGGTGLGLSISYLIIEKHHGSMHFDSIPGKGTCVQVFLPVIA